MPFPARRAYPRRYGINYVVLTPYPDFVLLAVDRLTVAARYAGFASARR
jgi:hypothetical protein